MKDEKRRRERYRVRVNRERFVFDEPAPTREEILEKAGLTPPDQWSLRLKLRGQCHELIQPGATVDLTRPGIERFKALPRDQNEGEQAPRRLFSLPDDDLTFLDGYGCTWESVIEGDSQWVLLHDFSTRHPGYSEDRVIAAVLLSGGYPKAALDMVYFHPAISRKDGQPIRATSSAQIDGKTFQRWSRHRSPNNPWKIGEDNLETHVLMVEDWLLREFS